MLDMTFDIIGILANSDSLSDIAWDYVIDEIWDFLWEHGVDVELLWDMAWDYSNSVASRT